jgi:hypothetical protein
MTYNPPHAPPIRNSRRDAGSADRAGSGWTRPLGRRASAEARLTDEARPQVKDLLGDADMADAEVVNWADQIRRERKTTAPWHYVNIPQRAT